MEPLPLPLFFLTSTANLLAEMKAISAPEKSADKSRNKSMDAIIIIPQKYTILKKTLIYRISSGCPNVYSSLNNFSEGIMASMDLMVPILKF